MSDNDYFIELKIEAVRAALAALHETSGNDEHAKAVLADAGLTRNSAPQWINQQQAALRTRQLREQRRRSKPSHIRSWRDEGWKS
jgi:hypothetical protein